jgi:arylsulfatase A-like enzyme
VLLLATDQQRADALGVTGARARTPNMDALAARGVTFARSYCSYPLCSPSRGSLLTGRTPHEIGVDRNERAIAPGIAISGQLFRAAGYDTGYSGKWHLPWGIPRDNDAGFEALAGHDLPGKTKGKSAPENRSWASAFDEATADAAIEFIEREREKPFFLVVSFENPHDICWLATDRTADAFRAHYGLVDGPDLPPLPANFDALVPALADHAGPKRAEWSEETWRRYLHGYDRLLEEVDREIGRVLEALRKTGAEDDTLVVFTSDHGEGLGSHGWVGKQMFYEETVAVPLVVSFAGVTPQRIDRTHLASTLDVLPTICDYAGIAVPADVRGTSLRGVIEHPERPGHEFVVSEMSPSMPGNPQGPGRSFMLRTARYKYMLFPEWSGDPTEVLFDLEADPGETRDLAGEPLLAEVLQRHRMLLARWRAWSRESEYPVVPWRQPRAESPGK